MYRFVAVVVQGVVGDVVVDVVVSQTPYSPLIVRTVGYGDGVDPEQTKVVYV